MSSAGSQRINNFYFHEKFPFSAIPINQFIICLFVFCLTIDYKNFFQENLFRNKGHVTLSNQIAGISGAYVLIFKLTVTFKSANQILFTFGSDQSDCREPTLKHLSSLGVSFGIFIVKHGRL